MHLHLSLLNFQASAGSSVLSTQGDQSEVGLKCSMISEVINAMFSHISNGSRGRNIKISLMASFPHCGRVFSRGTHMRSHMRTHEEKRTKVICPVERCEKKYSDIKGWKVHFQTSHNNQKKLFNFFEKKTEIRGGGCSKSADHCRKLMLENAQLRDRIIIRNTNTNMKYHFQRQLRSLLETFTNNHFSYPYPNRIYFSNRIRSVIGKRFGCCSDMDTDNGYP